MMARHRAAWARCRAAQARYRVARGALWDNAEAERAAGVDWETPAYHRLNGDYWRAHQAVPWWLRW